jgi:Tripartite tricarboxylate transporter family receptor
VRGAHGYEEAARRPGPCRIASFERDRKLDPSLRRAVPDDDGIEVVHVPYRVTPAAHSALMAGDVHAMMFDAVGSAVPHIQSRGLRALGVTATALSLELCRRGERLGGIHNEHDELIEIGRAAAENLHGDVGTMPRHGLASLDMAHAVRSPLAQPAGQHVEGLRAGVRMHRRLGLGWTTGMVDAQQILGRSDRGHRPNLDATLLLPGVEPPLRPSVNSQILPATSAASDVSPAAASACVSVEKFSSRQYSGPAGSCLSFFSATGVTKNFPCADAVDGDSNNPIAHGVRAKATRRRAADVRRFIGPLLGCPRCSTSQV